MARRGLIFGVIGRRLRVPVAAQSVEQAADRFGWFALFAGMDVRPRAGRRGRC
jgi:hypothetical protein